MLPTFEDCPYCGCQGLKRSHSSLYELSGWLHICKTTPLKHQQLAWNRNDSQTHQDVGNEDIVWNVGSEVGGEGEFYRYSDSY